MARLFKGEAVRWLCAAALLAAPLGLLALARAADLYPGTGAAMSAASPGTTLTDPAVLISTPSSPVNGSYRNTSTVNFYWIGPSTTAAAQLGEGSYYLLEVATAPVFTEDVTVIRVSTAPEINILDATHDGSFTSTDTLLSGVTHYWRVAAVDGLTQATAPWSQTFSFTTDYVPPTQFIQFPADASANNSLPEIYGTAADNFAISQVLISIKDNSLNKYWDGAGWNLAEAWLNATVLLPSWGYTNVPVWAPDNGYTAVAKTQDQAGNWSAVYSTVTFTYDGVAPSPAIDLAASAISSVSLNISWTATGDNAAIGELNGGMFAIQHSTYETGMAWSTVTAQVSIATSAVTPNTSQYYALSGLSPNTSYYFRLWTRDEADNWSTISNAASGVSMTEDPTSVYIDEVSSTTIVASAYAPGAAFSNMQHGASGVAVSTEAGVYNVWGSSGNYWSAKAAMNHPRFHHASAALGGKLYAIGGNNGSDMNSVEEYDPVSNVWTDKGNLPTARQKVAAAAAGGRIYAVGGVTSGSAVSANAEYDPATGQWTARRSMNTARMLPAVAAWGGKIYAFGGDSGSAALNVSEEYDPWTDTWATKDVMPQARAGAGAAEAGGKIYVVGGYNSGDKASNYVYDPALNTWATKADMLTARESFVVAAVGGKIYAVGGYSGFRLDVNEMYDPSADTWTARAPLSEGRYSFSGAALHGRVYALGGLTGSLSAANEVYEPGVARAVTGLKPNTQYTFKAKSRNQAGLVGAESLPGVSTYTLAAVGLPDIGQPITSVSSYSAMVVWSTGSAITGWNGPGANFLVEASTSSDFLGVKISSNAGDSFSFVAQSLLPNTTYHFRIRAYNAGGMTDYSWLALGSTVTHIETPTSVYVDEVTTTSIVASAYAPGSAFTGMERQGSAVSIAKNGAYDLWGSSGNYWATKAAMTTARYGAAAAAIGGKIYVVGGYNAGYKSANEEYDPVANTWASKTSMPTPRCYLAAAAAGGRLYALGGNNGSNLATNEEYDPAANTWATKTALPSARAYLSAVALSGKIYAMGGDNGSNLNLNQAYDLAADSWTTKAPMSAARSAMGAAAVGGKIYALGGTNGSPLTTNEEYDPGSNTWATKAAMPTARNYLAAVAVGGKVYAVGGYNSGYKNTNEAYDPGSNTWSTKASLSAARSNVAAGAVGGRIYAVGGNNSSPLGVNEEYTPGVARVFSALQPNTQYTFKSKARNQAGVETGDSVTVSTYTHAAVGMPQSGEPFSDVTSASALVHWSSGTGTAYNGAGASFLVVASTSSDYIGALNVSSYTYNVSSATLQLGANTTYYFRIQAYNAGGMTDYSWLALGSTVTMVNPPISMPVAATSTDSITAAWDANSNSAGTLYNIQISPDQSFAPVVDSSRTTDTSYTFLGLGVNTSYYLRVNAENRAGSPTPWVTLPSTYTAIEPPTTVYMDEVGTTTIVASAYAPGDAFTKLNYGVSGVNVTTGTLYGDWNIVADTWNSKALISTGRYLLAGASLNGKVYNFGGTNGVTNYSIAQEYDPATNVVKNVTYMNASRYLLAAAAAAGKVYVLGGSVGAGATTVNEEFDPIANSWAARAAMPQARSDFAAAAVNGKVYAMGAGTMDEYDPALDSWSSRAPMLTSRSGLAAGVVGGKIYAVGGSGDSDVNEEYDPVLDAWTAKASMSMGRVGAGAEGAGGKLYVYGGMSGGSQKSINEMYDPVSNTWISRTSGPTWYYMGTGAAYGKVYGMGGYNGSYLTINYEYTPGAAKTFAGLQPNTQYTFKAKVRNLEGQVTPESASVSTYTLAAVGLPGSEPITAVYASSVTVAWSSGTASGGWNGPGASYKVVASTSSDYLGSNISSVTYNVSGATLENLAANTTYYFRVQAYNSGGMTDYSWLALGSTVTRIETPSAVYIEEVGVTTITASAYAPGAAFSNLEQGLSGVNLATGTLYGVWPSSVNYWSSRTGMNTDRNNLSAAVIGGKIYAVGGYSVGSYVTTTQEYDPAADAWTTKGSMNTGRQAFVLAAIKGKLYAVGGTNGSALNVNEEYDPAINAWTTKTPANYTRYGAAGGVINDKLYVVGGNNGSIQVGYNEQYDPATDTWAIKSVMTPGRDFMAAAVAGAKLYAIGGSNGSAVTTNQAYDPDLNTWSNLQALPGARMYLRAETIGGKIYALGGYNGGVLSTNTVYDPATDAWNTKASMPAAQYLFASAATGGRLYVITENTINYEYNPGVSEKLSGLTPNTLYNIRAAARGRDGAQTQDSPAVSTYTLAYVGLPQGGQAITSVYVSSAAVNWSSGTAAAGWNGPGASFLVEASTSPDYRGTNVSSFTYNVDGATLPLSANTTYYLRVRAYNAGGMTDYGWLTLGSTVTRIETPESVVVDAVHLSSITVSAFSAGGFTNLALTPSGINHARNNTYAGWVQTTSVDFTGLQPNTPHTFKAKARNQAEVETAESAEVSTYTLAAVALPQSGEPFEGVYQTSVTVAWSSGTGTAFNGPGASFRVEASTAPDYSGTNVSSVTYNVSWATLDNLNSNASYYFRIQAYNAGGMTDYSWLALGSTVTLVNPPVALPVLAVSSWTITAQWGANGNAPDTVYNAEVYSDLAMTSLVYSTEVSNTWAVLSPLPVANTYYYMQVNAENRAGSPTGWVALGSTATAIQAPTSVNFTGYSTITLQTMAAGTFSGLAEELSAIAQAIDGLYGAWDLTSGGYFENLTPNTEYTIKAKARNRLGVETSETAGDSAYTLAAVALPESGTVFTSVWLSSAAVAWSSGTAAGGYNGPGARFELQASTAADYTGTVITSSTYNVDGAALDLAANTSYYFQVKAFNSAGSSDGIWLALGSTATAIETPTDIGFTVHPASITVQVYGTPGFSNLSSGDSSLNKAIDGLYEGWFNSTVSDFAGLIPNTQYTFSAKARNLEGRETPAISRSTWTLAEMPDSAFFSAASSGTLWLGWGQAGNPIGTDYLAEISSSADYSGTVLSSFTKAASASIDGLLANTTYYGRVAAVNGAGIYTSYKIFDDTVTRMNDPEGVNVTEVTTTSLVATAYAAGGFPNLDLGESGLNHAIDGSYAGWVHLTSAAFSGLQPNKQYQLKAKARNQQGHETAESVAVATYTLAAVVLSTGATFTEVYESSVTVAYSSGTDAGGYNGPGALYQVEASTAADFTGSLFLGAMFNPDDIFRMVEGLGSNTTYHFRVQVYNSGGITDGGWLTLGTTVTHAIVPAGAAQPFAGVTDSGLTAYWGANGNSDGTSYRVQFSTSQDFTPVDREDYPVTDLSLTIGGLAANTSYYARVAAVSYSGVQTAYYVIGGTITLQNAPTGIVFTAVSSRAITAQAYAAGGFPNLLEGESRINISLDGGWSGWTQFDYAEYTAMVPNKLYTFKARARNQAATETAESPEVSTYTLAAVSAAQDGRPFADVSTGAITVQWSSGTAADGFNEAAAVYRVQFDNAGTFAPISGSADTSSLSQAFSGLWPNTTHYFRGAAFNADGVFSDDWQLLGSTSTLADPVSGTSIVEVFSTSVTLNWNALPPAPSSSTCEGYALEASTHSGFAAVIRSSVTAGSAQASLTVQGLFADATYYFRVATLNHNGARNYAAAGSTVTLTETEPPVITNNEAYDYTWYGAEARTYNVDFADTGGSALEKFQVKATTAVGQAGLVTVDWTDILVGIDADDYTADWALGAGVWDLLQDGTNYVSVRAYDGAGNTDLATDAFVVFKDTTPPVISENYPDGVWRSTYGFTMPLSFADPNSLLDTAEAAIWSGPGLTGSELSAWAPLFSGAATASQSISPLLGQPVWDLLASGTNYVSLRAWDYSVPVNTNTWTDAFTILKDTAPPAAIADLGLVSGSTYAIQAAFSAPQEGPSGIAEFAVQYASYTAAWSPYAAAGSTHVFASTSGVVAGQQQQFGFTDLAGNTTYYFRAWARDLAANWSAESNAAGIATLAEAPVLTSDPEVFTSSAGAAWTPVAAAGFRLEASTDAAHAGVLLTSVTADGAASSIYITGLAPNTTYYLRLASLNWTGLPNYGGTYENSTFAVAPGSAAVYTDVSSGSVIVEWLSNGNGPGTRYELQASSDGFTSLLTSTITQPAGAGPYSYTFSGLAPNTTYWFNALAIGNRGDADQWLSLGSTVTAPVPPVLTGYTLWTGSAAVTWDANGNGAGTRYQCDLSTSAAFSGVLLSSSEADVFSFDMGPLATNTTYYLRLRAVSDFTGMVSQYVTDAGLTLAAAPAGVGSWTQGPNSVGVHWDAEGNPGVSGYGSFADGTDLPAAVYGHAAAIAGDLVFSAGGYDGAEYKTAVWSAPLSAEGAIGSWTRQRDLPAARYAHSAAALRGRLYVIGGYDGVSPRAEVWSAPISSAGALGAWVTEAPLPLAVYAHAMAVGDNTIYVLGGYNGGARNTVWYARVNSDGSLAGWTAGTALPQASYSLAAGMSGSHLYVTGGYDSLSAASAVRRAPLNGDGSIGAWSSDIALPSGVYAHAMETLPGALIISGGNGGTLPRSTTLLGALNADGSVAGWTTGGTLPAARQSHVMASRGGRLLALGGYDGAARADGYYAALSGTEYRLQVAGPSTYYTPWQPGGWLDVGSLTPNTGYTFTPAARNYAGVEAPGAVSYSTVTYAATPSSAAFSGVFISSAQANWLGADNPDGTVYAAELSSDAAHTQPAYSSDTANGYALFTGLDDDYTYYARVRAVNTAGVFTPWTELGSFTTRADPALDFSSPTITNNQAGDDNWRAAAGTLYDVDFADLGGAYLDRFQVRAATYPASPDAPWTDVMTAMDVSSFSDNWALPAGFFDLLEAGTSYISVRSWDANNNSAELADAFYVLKDTEAPVITDSQAGESAWRMDDAGAAYDVDFADAVSGLAAIEYSASHNAGSGDAAGYPWTPVVAVSSGLKSYTDNWAVDFAGLPNDATNYISVRARDLAGNAVTVTGVDVFKILKYVAGPEVGLTSPAAAYHSALAQISGTADDARSHAILGVEVSVLDADSGRYWDGTGFLALARVWFTAAGTSTWTYAPGITWPEGGSYSVVARSSDTAGNYSLAYATANFTFDSQAPVLGLTAPADGSTVNTAAVITGTALDLSGVSGMALRFKRLSDSYWWDFSAGTWTVSGSSAAVAGGSAWTYSPPQLLRAWLESGASYYYSLYAVDSSSPALETPFYVYGSSFNFVDDTPPAAVAGLAASTGSVPGSLRLDWTAPGDDAADGMILAGRYAVQYSTWSGAEFSTAAAQVNIDFSQGSAGAARFTEVTGLVAGATYYARLWTRDDAGNWSALSNGATAQAATYPDQVGGRVTKSTGEGITGVLVEVFDASGLLQGSAYTLNDGSGTYLVSGLPAGSYRVQATWSANDIISSVGTDGVPLGTVNADFTLAVTYDLASIGGSLPGYAPARPGLAPSAARPRNAAPVELYQRGRLVATAPVDAAGRFLIGNLLPGSYTLKVPNPEGGAKELSVRLKPGEALQVSPLGTLLKTDKVYVYPNPAGHLATFHIESDLNPVRVQLAIFDITGKLVGKLSETDFSARNGGLEADWNVPSKVAPGVYVYSVHVKYEPTGEHKNVVRKFAIVK